MGNASACSQVNVRSFKEIDPLDTDKMFAKKPFMKTGCLMTADGSNDDMIKPRGLEPYCF